jgi:hypothetical protein
MSSLQAERAAAEDTPIERVSLEANERKKIYIGGFTLHISNAAVLKQNPQLPRVS